MNKMGSGDKAPEKNLRNLLKIMVFSLVYLDRQEPSGAEPKRENCPIPYLATHGLLSTCEKMAHTH